MNLSTDGQTDGWTDEQIRWNQYTLYKIAVGYNTLVTDNYILEISRTITWGSWCLKSLVTRFVQTNKPQLVQTYKKERKQFCIPSPLWGKTPVTGGFPTQRASNAESDSMSWHHQIHIMWWQNCHDDDLKTKSSWCQLFHHWRELFVLAVMPKLASWGLSVFIDGSL